MSYFDRINLFLCKNMLSLSLLKLNRAESIPKINSSNRIILYPVNYFKNYI